MKNKVMTFKLEDDLQEEIKKASKKFHISKSALIRMAIIEKLNKLQKEV